MKEENTLRHSLGPKMERAGPEQCPTILPQDHNPVMYVNVTMTLQSDQNVVRWLLFPFDNGYNHARGVAPLIQK
ncbi:hypothetical protein FEMY_00020 [Ferrovum myxofaciens]|jgi:hypothetical protein|uniref:Uncharacterized protein n=1 Tax=Ferrovum myxofaciens TaxID=416213 RepID=A0A149W1L7_9PROT|nr:hypothetical protein FEMY_00020 [Ferrovum myxofaciens]